MAAVQKQVDEVRNIMVDNIDKVRVCLAAGSVKQPQWQPVLSCTSALPVLCWAPWDLVSGSLTAYRTAGAPYQRAAALRLQRSVSCGLLCSVC